MITLENVEKSYRTRRGMRPVLKQVNLTIQPGERVGVLGRNGAGKSTLVRIIGGAEQPSAGRVRRDMSVSWPLAFQGGFQTSLTGLDNLRFICRIYDADIQKAIPFVEEFAELGEYLREPVKTYSAGMFSRLGFAISMAIEFDCYLIDEVLAVGDSRFSERCKVELFEKRKDRAMILVSHSPDAIRRYCEAVYVLDDGHLVRYDDLDRAYEHYNGIV